MKMIAQILLAKVPNQEGLGMLVILNQIHEL